MRLLTVIAWCALFVGPGWGVAASAGPIVGARSASAVLKPAEAPRFQDALTATAHHVDPSRPSLKRHKGVMDIEHVIALMLIVAGTGVGMVVATLSKRARDIGFFLMVAGAVFTNRMDVNFFSQEWYRGTTRGVEVTAIDIIALCLIVGSVLTPRYPKLPRIYWPGGLAFMGLYAAYCLFSVLKSTPHMFGAFELTKILRGIMFFMAAALFVRTRRELVILVSALGCAVVLQAVFSVQQRYLYHVHRVGGSVEDPNSLSMYICLVSPIFVATASLADCPRLLRALCWICFGAAALSVLMTISRAGIPIFGMVMLGTTVFCVSWKPTLKKAAVTGVILLLAVAAMFKAWDMVMDRYEQATLSEEYLDPKNEGRGVYFRWAKAILKDHPFGVGLGNWSYWVSAIYGPDAGFPYLAYDDIKTDPRDITLANAVYAAPAHNLGVLTVGELGWAGLFCFALVWMRYFWMGFTFLWTFRSPDPMRRLGIGLFFCVCGIFLQSITEWVYRQTPIFLTFHILVGTLASLHYHKRLEMRRLKERKAEVADLQDVMELNPRASGI